MYRYLRSKVEIKTRMSLAREDLNDMKNLLCSSIDLEKKLYSAVSGVYIDVKCGLWKGEKIFGFKN